MADAAVGSGDNTITINGHGFVVGDKIFISKSDNTGIQYLGPVTAKDTNSITTTYGANESKGTGVKVWKPGTLVAFSRGEDRNWSRRRQTGTRTEVSRGGVVYSINTADGAEVVRMAFEGGARTDYAAWRAFLVSNRSDGASSFVAAYWDWQENAGKVQEARWAGSDLAFEVGGVGDVSRGVGRFEIGFWIVDDDAWVES